MDQHGFAAICMCFKRRCYSVYAIRKGYEVAIGKTHANSKPTATNSLDIHSYSNQSEHSKGKALKAHVNSSQLRKCLKTHMPAHEKNAPEKSVFSR